MLIFSLPHPQIVNIEQYTSKEHLADKLKALNFFFLIFWNRGYLGANFQK
jgi:hypothetical protein